MDVCVCFVIPTGRFSDLEKRFKNNMHCLLYKAKLQVDMDSLIEAQATFNRVRRRYH